MSDSSTVWLAIIAIAVAVMALMQVGIAIAAWRVGKQVAAATEEIRRDLRPLIGKMNGIADEAAYTTSLVRLQVERLDALVASTTERVDETINVVQGAIVAPVRQGAALLTAVRAAFAAFRRGGSRTGPTRDEEEAWFVG